MQHTYYTIQFNIHNTNKCNRIPVIHQICIKAKICNTTHLAKGENREYGLNP